jgi:hydrogenase maturation factor
MMGPTKYAYRATDIRPGDAVLLTKHMGLEGMAILANDRPDLLRGVLDASELSEVRSWLDHISVLGESRILRDLAKFLHDPTEGGVGGGIAEIMRLSGLGVDLDMEKVPLSPLTRRAAEHLQFDPLHLISSGVLMAVVPQEHEDRAMERLREAGIDGVIAGRMTDGPGNCADDVTEELWGLLERPKGEGQ